MANETYTQPHHVEDVEIQEWFDRWTRCWRRADRTWREILERLRAHATGAALTFLLRRILPTRTRFRCG